MTKKESSALAELLRKPGHIEAAIRRGMGVLKLPDNEYEEVAKDIKDAIAEELADFCKSHNGAFDRERWLGYVHGKNGPSGGKVKGGK